MLNRITFAFAAALFLTTSSLAARADMLDTITDAPSSIFQFFRGVIASDAPKQSPVLVEVIEAPRAEAPARPDEVLSPRLRSTMSKRDAFGARQLVVGQFHHEGRGFVVAPHRDFRDERHGKRAGNAGGVKPEHHKALQIDEAPQFALRKRQRIKLGFSALNPSFETGARIGRPA